ncbi:MAG: right-handed parallel beta-helix repeat-containing protein [Anaerolineae bacterium]|nr:right-handed parallel beta-helix repeat-containing protein [Anaerolineae bacterium]
MRMPRTVLWLLIVSICAGLTPGALPASAAPVIPPVWDILADDFEGGSLDAWQLSSAPMPVLAPGSGIHGSTGLSVPVSGDAAYIYQTKVAKAEEGYLTFWFNPNGVNLPEPDPNWWPPGTSLSIAEVVNSENWWPPLAALYVRRPPGEGYQAYLAWPTDEEGTRHYGYENAFDLVDGWQRITLGYRIDAWVAVWVNGALVRYEDTTVVHPDPYGDIVFVGKARTNSSTPSGTILFDDVAFQVPRVNDLWVDAQNGDDHEDGLFRVTALRTIQRAADLAGPGTTVHILPGVYRESVWPALNGTAAEPVRYVAEDGPGTVALRGSEPSSSLTWTQLTANGIGLPPGVDPAQVYYADLSAWQLTAPPRFLVAFDAAEAAPAAGPGTRLPLAREPDWSVATEWKTHEFWWAADGGSAPAACDPATDSDPNCDLPQRSTTQLTDHTSDPSPAGIEPGNLTTLGDLTGATLVAIDTLQGHYNYRRVITDHDVGDGRITVDRICEHDGGTGNPGLGWGTKYFVENKHALLDTPGEWWYDAANGRLYLWPPTPGDPASQSIEISRRDYGFSLRNRSYTILDGLTIELVNDRAISQHNWTEHRSYGNTLRALLVRYANYGVYIEQDVAVDESPGNVIDGFTLEASEVAHIDSQGVRLIDWWEYGADPDAFTHSGIRNTVIRGNDFHHLGFRTDGDNAIGLSFSFANDLTFENNHVHHIAHNGVQFSKSVIQSSKTYGFDPSEIKTGGILIKDNVFEQACQLTTDCGGLKIWGSPPDNHVFRDVLITGNVFRDTFGWSYISEQRGRYSGGESSDVQGMGAYGLFVDHASGLHVYRNIAYNNAYTGYLLYGVWRDGQMVYVNNVAANGLYGISLGGGQYDTHGAVDTRVLNNILVNNEAFGLSLSYAEGHEANTVVDHNLYYNNGWRSFEEGGIWHAGAMVVREGGSWDPYITLAEAQAAAPWEDHGIESDPAFYDHDVTDHALHDGSWADFHPVSASAAIDRGTMALPASLVALLEAFGVEDDVRGVAYDMGRYEAGFALRAAPGFRAIAAGTDALYTLSLEPVDLPYAVGLAIDVGSPDIAITLSQASLALTETVALTVTHLGPPVTGWHTVAITGTGGGFEGATTVRLLVNGHGIYLPVVGRR